MLEIALNRKEKIFKISRFALLFLSPLVLLVLLLDLFILENLLSVSLVLVLIILLLVNFIIYSVFSQTATIEHYREIWQLNHDFFPWFFTIYLLALILNYLKVFVLPNFFIDYLSFLLILSGLISLVNLEKFKNFLKKK